MNRNKKSSQFKKNTQQLHQYRRSLNQPKELKQTYDTGENEDLIGTEEYQAESIIKKPNNKQKIKGKSIKRKVTDWIKEHWLDSIVIVIFVAIVTAVIKQQIQLATIETRLDYIEKNLSSLSSDSVSKENLELQLNAMKLQLDNSILVNTKDLETRISNIENNISEK